VSTFGKMNLTFLKYRVKINGINYCDALLTQQLLPVVREISGKFLCIPSRYALAH